jgi:hypothetical protein
MLIACLAAAVLFGCSEKSPTTEQAQKQAEQSAPAVAQTEKSEKPAPMPDSAEIVGTVMTTDRGLALNTASGLITISGADLSAMVGKKVKVTGAISEAQEGKVIEVMTATPLE